MVSFCMRTCKHDAFGALDFDMLACKQSLSHDAGEGKDIELRHQRNPDVLFDCVRKQDGENSRLFLFA